MPTPLDLSAEIFAIARLDDGELDAPLAADQFDASDETLIPASAS